MRQCKKCRRRQAWCRFRVSGGYRLRTCRRCEAARTKRYFASRRGAETRKRYNSTKGRVWHKTAAGRRSVEKYRRSAKYKSRHVVMTRKYRKLYPDRYRARLRVGAAVRSGKLIRPKRCQKCKSRGRVEAHHQDYSRPLDVQWLCTACHNQADKLCTH